MRGRRALMRHPVSSDAAARLLAADPARVSASTLSARVGAPHDTALLRRAAAYGDGLRQRGGRMDLQHAIEHSELVAIELIELPHCLWRVVISEPPEPV